MTAPAIDLPGSADHGTAGHRPDDGDARLIADAYRERQTRQMLRNIRVCAWSVPVAAVVMGVSSGSGYDIFGALLFAMALAAYSRLLRRYRALSGHWRFY